MKILVECTVRETGEHWHFEMEGPENSIEDLEKTVRDALGIMSSLIEIKIKSCATYIVYIS